MRENLKEKYLFVYEKDLSFYLRSKGHSYILRAKTLSDVEFTLYEKTEGIKKAIIQYKELSKGAIK